MEVVVPPRVRALRQNRHGTSPKDRGLALARHAAQRFFRSARGGDCFQLTVCSIPTNRNTLVISDLEARTLQKGE